MTAAPTISRSTPMTRERRCDAGDHSSPASHPPRRLIDITECDWCNKAFTVDLLWRIYGEGLLCAGCCERLIEAERDQ